MAKVRTNPIIERITGAIGDLVFRRRMGRLFISRKPDMSDYVPTEAQLAHRDRFRVATVYALAALEDEETRDFYVAQGQRRGISAYSAAVADFLVPPTVTEIDVSDYRGQVEDVITVTARDDSGVARVNVEIIDAEGSVIESGEAEELLLHWQYTVQTTAPEGETVTVHVRAEDFPGNVATASEEVAIPAA